LKKPRNIREAHSARRRRIGGHCPRRAWAKPGGSKTAAQGLHDTPGSDAMSILDFDDVIEVLDRIRAEKKAIRAENESRRIWFEKIASTLCGRKISVNFTTDIGSTYTGAEGIGSSDRNSIVILNNLDKVTEHCVFCHEVAHCYLQHHSSGSGDHTASQKEFLDLLPETVREEVRVELDGKEIDADKFGRKLFKAFWPDETWNTA
jgi:hypothetical protein